MLPSDGSVCTGVHIVFVNILALVILFWNVQCKVDHISTSDDAESVYCLPLSENHQHIQNLLWRLLKSLSCTLCFICTLNDNKRMELIQKMCSLPASYHWLVCTYSHLMVRCTKICHVLSNVCILFPLLPHFWPKRIVADLGSELCNDIKLYVFVNVWVCRNVAYHNSYSQTKRVSDDLRRLDHYQHHCCNFVSWITLIFQMKPNSMLGCYLFFN